MAAQTPDVYSGNIRPQNSDEIDLRRYLLVLLRWWREIVVISLLAGAITGITIVLLNNSKTPVYAANADILIARLSSNIELDDRVSTSAGAGQGDQNGWRTSLLQLVNSSDVANAVLAELKDALPVSLQSPEALAGVISASIPLSADERYASNIIRVTATTATPDVSAKIANSWAHHLVDYINGLYGEVPETMIQSVTAERDDALANYQTAQKAYEDFVATNQISVLTRQVDEKSTLRNELMLNYTRMLTSVVSTEYNARLDLYNSLANAPATYAASLIEAQTKGNVRSLDSLYSLRVSAVTQLNQARIMERSLVDGGEAAAKSNVAALQLLKLATFATLHGNEAFPSGVALAGPPQNVAMSLDEQLTDVRALVSTLEGYVAQLEDDIKQQSESTMMGADLAAVGGLVNGVDTSTESAESVANDDITSAYSQLFAPGGILEQAPIDISSMDNEHEQLLTTLEGEIRRLQAALSAEKAKEQQLTHQRDLAWTTYDTVGNKLQELSLLRSSANSEVRTGNPAVIPAAPQLQTSPVLPVIATTLLGFFLAIILALLVDSLGGGPFFARRPA
jgi:uncharacterized protein involved in exopolysaccharide biosynthesis